MSTLYPPVISPVTTPADGFWQVVSGSKESGVYVFCRNNDNAWAEASYTDGLSGLKWSYNMPLSNGDNIIEVVSRETQISSATDSQPSSATIHLIVSTPEEYNVWNAFDEFGVLLGLPRLPGEKNADYKARLLAVSTSPANSTYTGLMNGISRELGITTDEIEITELSTLMDPSSEKCLLNDNNNAIGTKLVDYADEVYDNNPIFWGTVVADESYWDSVDETTNGFNYLPHIWDPVASGIYDKWQMSGIGDQDDLWVDGPIEEWNEDIGAYSWYMKIHSGYFYSTYPSGMFSQ